jgi:AmiR/NasT family two-component response regulator
MSENMPLRVLVAEDDFLISEEVVRCVRKIGWEVVGEAGTGAEAIEKTLALDPDLVLMDIKMPEMDGVEASRQIQELHPTPVVILTAQGTPDLLDRACEAGVAAYLTKPPDSGQIERAASIALARFDDLMEIHRLNQELLARNAELEAALETIKTMEGLFTICSSCKKLPDDDGNWIPLERYVSKHTRVKFSHGLCPVCYGRMMAQIDAMTVD